MAELPTALSKAEFHFVGTGQETENGALVSVDLDLGLDAPRRVYAQVANPGLRAQRRTLSLRKDGEVIDSRDAELTAEASAAVALLEVPRPAYGRLLVLGVYVVGRKRQPRRVVLEVALVVDLGLTTEALGGRFVGREDRVAGVAAADLHPHALEEEDLAVLPDHRREQAP